MNDRQFLRQQITWIMIGFGISIAISLVVPFPYSIGVMIPVFLGLSYFVRMRALKKMGMNFSQSMFGYKERRIEFYCMNCGTKHNNRACPNCGSTATKVG